MFWLSTFRLLALAVFTAACQSEDSRAESRRPAADTAFRVALLTPGPVSDQSWNGGAYAGLLAIRDSLDARVSHVQTKTPAEFDENFRQYGAEQYDLVFGHGFEFQDAAVRVAAEYPRTVFVTTSGNTVRLNVAGIQFAFADGSFLAGMLAGFLTKSNTIGAIGGTELPPVKEGFAAFAEGAKAVNPRVDVLVSYIGNWDDASSAREQALAQIARHADVIFQNADAAGLGVFQAARTAGSTYVIGSNADQNGVAPDVTAASVVIDLPRAFLLVARAVKQRPFTAKVFELGTRDEVVRLAFNPTLSGRIPAAARAAVDSVRKLIDAGTFRPRAHTTVTPAP